MLSFCQDEKHEPKIYLALFSRLNIGELIDCPVLYYNILLTSDDVIIAFIMRITKLLSAIFITGASAQKFPDCANGPVSNITRLNCNLILKLYLLALASWPTTRFVIRQLIRIKELPL